MFRRLMTLIMMVFCVYFVNAQNLDHEYKLYIGNPINISFWEQLDSIRKNVYKEKYKYYRIFVSNAHDSEEIQLEYTPQKTDTVFYFVLQGCSRPQSIDYYKTDFKNTGYFIFKGVEDMFVKRKKKTSIHAPLRAYHRDLSAPMLLLTYKDGVLMIVEDSKNK